MKSLHALLQVPARVEPIYACGFAAKRRPDAPPNALNALNAIHMNRINHSCLQRPAYRCRDVRVVLVLRSSELSLPVIWLACTSHCDLMVNLLALVPV